MACSEMSELQMSLCITQAVFASYVDDLENNRMSECAFKKMLKEQIPMFENADEAFRTVDRDNSGSVDFCEFACLLCTCAMINNECFESMKKACKEKKEKGDCSMQQKGDCSMQQKGDCSQQRRCQ